ncbi:hypothetical protein K431DRAFT_165939 [Polychaeton citri CBS 116435]|uniref:Uncharacterized protein n=1 Tax=Polychaeton citri CBS 116435 TaxID=1314669 RepID=A0A9P4QFX9_9PEZI|nr:hypothetical protein K431DRAFT_165939 [Polychaeton citri CBS 116435]
MSNMAYFKCRLSHCQARASVEVRIAIWNHILAQVKVESSVSRTIDMRFGETTFANTNRVIGHGPRFGSAKVENLDLGRQLYRRETSDDSASEHDSGSQSMFGGYGVLMLCAQAALPSHEVPGDEYDVCASRNRIRRATCFEKRPVRATWYSPSLTAPRVPVKSLRLFCFAGPPDAVASITT